MKIYLSVKYNIFISVQAQYHFGKLPNDPFIYIYREREENFKLFIYFRDKHSSFVLVHSPDSNKHSRNSSQMFHWDARTQLLEPSLLPLKAHISSDLKLRV